MLLWRVTRDGFGGRHFHGRCDGHANTVLLILDTEGNIFGGFMPVEWESPSERKHNADPSLKSFLFTLKNPQDFPAMKSALKAEMKHEAIICDSWRGPHFCDIGVSNNYSANTGSFNGDFGGCYAKDTGGVAFFHGSDEVHCEGNRSLRDHRLNFPSKFCSPTTEIAI
jgi:hypothetical protein